MHLDVHIVRIPATNPYMNLPIIIVGVVCASVSPAPRKTKLFMIMIILLRPPTIRGPPMALLIVMPRRLELPIKVFQSLV
jgi:hypothetical protein